MKMNAPPQPLTEEGGDLIQQLEDCRAFQRHVRAKKPVHLYCMASRCVAFALAAVQEERASQRGLPS